MDEIFSCATTGERAKSGAQCAFAWLARRRIRFARAMTLIQDYSPSLIILPSSTPSVLLRHLRSAMPPSPSSLFCSRKGQKVRGRDNELSSRTRFLGQEPEISPDDNIKRYLARTILFPTAVFLVFFFLYTYFRTD